MLNRQSNYLVIILPSYNRLELLQRAIYSIRTGTRCSHEIIVIDGGSTDGTVEFLQTCPDITPVFQGKLLGQARACNQVWQQVDSKYTCWLSDDTEVVPKSLDLAVEILEENPRIGMVGLKMVDTIGNGTKKGYGGAVSELGILTCNHAVLALSTLREVGYFNEEYHTYGIDPDLTASVLCAGKAVVLTKMVSVLHHRVSGNREKRRNELTNSKQVYLEKFKFLKNSSYLSNVWRKQVRTRVWKLLLLQLRADATRFGLTRRDQINLITGRFIHFLDPLVNTRRPYYLSQQLPRRLLCAEANPYRHLLKNKRGPGFSGD